MQAAYPKFQPPTCNIFDPTAKCERVNGKNAALLFMALYLIALGSAGVKASLPTHGADQFDEKDPKETTQMSSYFNWLLLMVSIGGSVSITLIVWVQDNKGWNWGFFISTIAIFMGIIVFSGGLPQYRIHVTKGNSPMTELIQVSIHKDICIQVYLSLKQSMILKCSKTLILYRDL